MARQVPLTIRPSEAQRDKLDYIQKTSGLMMSEVVRRLIDVGLDDWAAKNLPPANRKLRKVAAVFFDLKESE